MRKLDSLQTPFLRLFQAVPTMIYASTTAWTKVSVRSFTLARQGDIYLQSSEDAKA